MQVKQSDGIMLILAGSSVPEVVENHGCSPAMLCTRTLCCRRWTCGRAEAIHRHKGSLSVDGLRSQPHNGESRPQRVVMCSPV